eukprot:7692407-Pyramimonas_sp.AAC.2
MCRWGQCQASTTNHNTDTSSLPLVGTCHSTFPFCLVEGIIGFFTYRAGERGSYQGTSAVSTRSSCSMICGVANGITCQEVLGVVVRRG